MSISITRRHARRTPSRVALIAVVTLLASLLAVLGSSSATADTTFTPSEPGATASDPRVVRDASVIVGTDQGARSYRRANAGATSLFTARTAGEVQLGAFLAGLGPILALGNTACLGALTPKDVITVTGPGADPTVVSATTSPIRNLSDNTPLKLEPANPQPAPSNVTYQGDVTDGDAYHGVKATVDLSGRPAGTYTVTTQTYNMVKTGTAACVIGTPTAAGNAFTPGPVTTTSTFEYRPWQANFKDALGNGKVHANIVPREFKYSLGSQSSPIYQGSPQNQTFFSYGGHFLLPSDPTACAELITNCLPNGAVECEPNTGCVPRIMVINQPDRGARDGIIGFFDLATKAFIATAQLNGTQRVLFSLGTDNDAAYHALLQGLADQLGASGTDLMAILGTKVVVANDQNQLSLSLLNGLQIDPTGPDGKGIRIYTPGTVQAGVILNIHGTLRTGGTSCVANAASSADGPTRYTRNEPNGYTVNKTDLLPEVPSVGPLAAIVGGPVYSIRGKFTGGGTGATVSTAVIGVDTAADEPNGYPVWISPFISGIRTGAPKTMDFLGTATWSASEAPVPVLGGCLVLDFMVGTGVAIYDNPLAVGLHSLIDPDWDAESAARGPARIGRHGRVAGARPGHDQPGGRDAARRFGGILAAIRPSLRSPQH